MVLTRSYAALLVAAGVAHYGRVVHQDSRRWLEVIRGERIDYVLGVSVKLAPDEPPCWHPEGLPDRLMLWPSDGRLGARAPRRPKPKHDVLTEHGKGHKKWKRPKPETPERPRQYTRVCPNCKELTNRIGEHCVGVLTVALNPRPAKAPSVLKRAYQPYKPRKLRRVCECGDLTDELVHCEGRRTFAS